MTPFAMAPDAIHVDAIAREAIQARSREKGEADPAT